ncbi:MAG: TetR/AcrR family transcriptional regulator [Caulobacteraceae bacterium]|nr:TetR/AcrR family transcriptional regulator [Caulobacteraceae bacterium]
MVRSGAYPSAAVGTPRFALKRDAIIAAAAEIINRRGVRGMTLADVAASVGLITTSVTYYFKRKDDLAAACFMCAIQRMEALVVEAMAEAAPSDRLRRLVELHLDLDRRIRLGEEPPLAALGDIRGLNEPNRSATVAAYVTLFRKARELFLTDSFPWMTKRMATARTYLLIEQMLWFASWLHRYDLDDYSRVGVRMLDILNNGLMVPGGMWAPEGLEGWPPQPLDVAARSRDTFLLAATRLVNRHGYRGASVEKISAALNVTKGSFYHHNDAKDDLVVACFQRSFDLVRGAQTVAMHMPGDPWRQLSALTRALVEHQLSDRGPLLRISALSALPQTLRAQVIEASNRLSDRFAGLISDGVAQGVIRPVDPMIAAQMLNATFNAAADLRDHASGVTRDQVAELYAKPLLTGVFSP